MAASTSPRCIPMQRCTVASVAGHAMYERSNPYHEYVAGGLLDMQRMPLRAVQPEDHARHWPTLHSCAAESRVKLEGSARVGERFVGIAAVRDPYSVANVDLMIDWARGQVRERFGEQGYEVHYTVYGRDGVMGALEPVRTTGARAVHRGARRGADARDGRRGLHDRHTPVVLCAPTRRKGNRGLGSLRSWTR